MSDANRQHCADSAAEAACDEWEGWNDAVDIALISHRIVPSAFTKPERFSAWQDDIGPEDAAESFAQHYYDSGAGDNDEEDWSI